MFNLWSESLVRVYLFKFKQHKSSYNQSILAYVAPPDALSEQNKYENMSVVILSCVKLQHLADCLNLKYSYIIHTSEQSRVKDIAQGPNIVKA